MTNTVTIPHSAREEKPDDTVTVERVPEHIVEIVSDSGEGAQKAGQTFGGHQCQDG